MLSKNAIHPFQLSNLHKMTHANTNVWTFDLSSFMVLLSEDEELNYRLMRRSIYEILCTAPAAGLQSYLRSYSVAIEKVGPIYISQLGRKSAPLRNLRLANTIASYNLLCDSRYSVYQIPALQDTRNNLKDIRSLSWMLATWIITAAIITLLAILPDTSWVGIVNCAVLPGWSIALRIIESQCIYIATSSPSQPDCLDSVIIIGRRNSCLILEGSRQDISRWTGLGVEVKDSVSSKFTEYFTRITTLLILVFVFVSIPNGTLHDQVSFIAMNILGQANVKIGKYLNAKSCLGSLSKITSTNVPSRTHVYGLLLRRFGNGDWVDEVGLLPNTAIWKDWRKLVIASQSDSKELYEKIVQEHSKPKENLEILVHPETR
ncbi:uncharacterized protein K444DRAFT_660310 [Hyaloscypha bicolor E]|uniref:Uncharacterized protein n=1 Tax=Hyaloscypha bicolor E TaxID=1095630 RepID=A0A2J6TQ95_9HELO|nr:uncharacterized protein K444DRAFT_660310 [Hyaloscypha bicolor E]PMD65186.1 hypothetical protein K444DRAFT_660310 [Hyaloscypha bicolor E]